MKIKFLGFVFELPNLGKYRQFLTKNERRKICSEVNTDKGRALADSKYATKIRLQKSKVSVAPLIAQIRNRKELKKFNWDKLEENFVIKPAYGYGGEGILIIRKKAKKGNVWVKMNRKNISLEEIKRHCIDIFSGKYSLHDKPGVVLIEERIKIHPKFFSYTRSGTPDVRVILYKKIPIMAMLRVPTEESEGRANLEQGALGLGIDLASGLTTYCVAGKSKLTDTIYSFKLKGMRGVAGIRIPEWRKVLETSIACAMSVPELGFMGVDIVLDKERGPVVLEINARPGLSIQICNKAGLKARMEKVEDMEVHSIVHAFNICRYLFGEKVVGGNTTKDTPVVKPIERITLLVAKNQKGNTIRAKVDTGAFRSSIDRDLAQKLGLLSDDKILYFRNVSSSLGKHADRPVVGVTYILAGRKVRAEVNVVSRKNLKTKFLIGRKDLRGFVVKLAVPKTKVKNFVKRIK